MHDQTVIMASRKKESFLITKYNKKEITQSSNYFGMKTSHGKCASDMKIMRIFVSATPIRFNQCHFVAQVT